MPSSAEAGDASLAKFYQWQQLETFVKMFQI
jgi:hypothetical protein